MSAKPLHEVFLNEAEEIIAELEQGVVAIEANPREEETIHRLFRAAHTFKSSAGMLGFEPIVALAHMAESVMSRMRSGELQADNRVVTLLLSAVDEFKQMVGRVAAGEPIQPTNERSELMNALARYVAGPSAARPNRSPSLAAKPLPETPHVYRISMAFHPGIFRTGQDPNLLVGELRDLGDVRDVVVRFDDLPPFGQMAPESCYLAWSLLLLTDRPRSDLDAIFLFVSDENTIGITDITATSASVAAVAPLDAPLGELLVEEGCVSPEDVANAVHDQKRVGELLVDRGKVEQAHVDRVLAKQAAARQVRRTGTIRVDTEKLDRLMNLVGEMVIAIAQVHQTARNPATSTAVRLAAVEGLDQIGRDLQTQVMSVRMVAIEEVFTRLPRVVRDTAKELGKQVLLATEGGTTEMDKIVVEQLADPLRHMVRNAVAHAIEPSDERLRLGKPDTGRITLRAVRRQDRIVIEVEDDGRGIDTEAVLTKARTLGWVGADESPSEQEILQFLFRPGFSTAREVDEISGRGVGLDVVQKNVEGLRGSIQVESVLGRGTTFRIKLPLTLAIIEGMHVQVGPRTLTIPLLSVVELMSARTEDIHTVEAKGELVEVRGDYLPVVRLGELLGGGPRAPNSAESVIVVVEHEHRKFGLMIDKVLGMEQTVIKPLERAFSLVSCLDTAYRKPDVIAGATILGDGNVALILDVPGLERMAFRQDAG